MVMMYFTPIMIVLIMVMVMVITNIISALLRSGYLGFSRCHD